MFTLLVEFPSLCCTHTCVNVLADEERMRPSKGDLAPGSPAAQVVIAGVSSATPSPSSAHPAIVIAQPDDIQPHAIDEVPLMSLDPDVAALKIQAHARRLQASKRVDALKQQKERDRLQAEEQRRRRDETASAIKIQSIARRRGAQRAVEGIRKQVSLHPLETVDPTDSSVELYHRGHKLGLFGYCTVSVVDTGSGFAVRVYCPSTCQTLTTSFTCTSAAEAVGTSADLKEYSVVAEKLASRLFVTESGHLDLLLTTGSCVADASCTTLLYLLP